MGIGAAVGAGVSMLGSLANSGGGGGSEGQGQSSSQQSSYSEQKPSTYAPTEQGYLDTIPVYEGYGQKAITSLTQADRATQLATAPIIQGSYQAFDSLLDSLGVSRPQEGSYAQAKKQADYVLAGDKFKSYTDYQKNLVDSEAQARTDLMKAAKVDLGQYNAKYHGDLRDPSSEFGSVYQAVNDPNVTLDRLHEEALTNMEQSDRPGNASETLFPGWGKAMNKGLASWDAYQKLLKNPVEEALAPGQAPGAATMTDASQASARTQALLEADPDYQFRLSQGLKAISAMNAARGIQGTGRAGKELTTYGQGMASGAMQAYRDRLSGIVQQGLGAMGYATQSSGQTGAGIAQVQQNTGANIADATRNATNRFVVGPVTGYSQSQGTSQSTQSQSTSGGGLFGSAGPVIGAVSKGLGGVFNMMGGS